MSLTLTRREVLQFVGGSALGMLFSPLPWKLLDDTAIWTQNWPWIPKGLSGEISYGGTTCTLCQSACGMRTRLVGKQPVSLSGIPQHPFNDGSLCTMGILAHHLRYHPSRVRQAQKFSPEAETGTPVTVANALDALAGMMHGSPAAGSIVILDGRPGRTASALFRHLGAGNPAVQYIPTAAPALDILTTMAGVPLGPLGYDMDNARVILNFGAPLFDTWGSPSRAAKLFAAHAAGRQTVIHIEGVCSRSAARADQWIAARPGSEAALALSIANVMIEENLYAASAARTIGDFADFRAFVSTFTPDAVSKAAGVAPEAIRTAARAFASHAPALAVIGNESPVETRAAVMALNVLAGSIGRTGGVALRREIPDAPACTSPGTRAASLHELPDHSIRVLIVDESLSGSMVSDALLEKKLVAKDAVIISLSPFVTARPYCTQYVIPSTVVFETVTDVPGPFDSAASSLAVSKAMLQAPDGTMDAVQFALALAPALGAPITASGTSEDIVKQRCAAIHATQRGTVFAPSTGQRVNVKDLGTADDLWNALADGGCWIDDAAHGTDAAAVTIMNAFRESTVRLPEAHETNQLYVVPFAEMKIYDGKSVSPLLGKVSQESGLRLSLRQAYVNPATAHGRSIANGDTISLTTKHGTMNVLAKIDASVMPDVLYVSTAGTRESGRSVPPAHDVRLLCDVSGSGSFSPTPVSLQKVLA
jgi:menaquinone reductase, molybdopterin-binding-like subunit